MLSGKAVHELSGEAVHELSSAAVLELSGAAVHELSGEAVLELSGETVHKLSGEVVLELSGEAVLELSREAVHKPSGVAVLELSGESKQSTSLAVSACQRTMSHGMCLLRHRQEYQMERLLWRLRSREAVVLASPPTLPSMSPSTVSSCFSVTGAWKGGPWLGCRDLPAMGESLGAG